MWPGVRWADLRKAKPAADTGQRGRSWYASGRGRSSTVSASMICHSCAPFLLTAGASPRTVMKTLGHSQIGLTMNTYTHVLPEIEREAIEAAAKVIFE